MFKFYTWFSIPEKNELNHNYNKLIITAVDDIDIDIDIDMDEKMNKDDFKLLEKYANILGGVVKILYTAAKEKEVFLLIKDSKLRKLLDSFDKYKVLSESSMEYLCNPLFKKGTKLDYKLYVKACEYRLIQLAEWLLDYSQDINRTDDTLRATIVFAPCFGSVPFMEKVAEKVEFDINSLELRTALAHSCSFGNVKIFKWIMEKYPFLSKIIVGKKLMTYAFFSGKIEMVSYLYENFKDIRNEMFCPVAYYELQKNNCTDITKYIDSKRHEYPTIPANLFKCTEYYCTLMDEDAVDYFVKKNDNESKDMLDDIKMLCHIYDDSKTLKYLSGLNKLSRVDVKVNPELLYVSITKWSVNVIEWMITTQNEIRNLIDPKRALFHLLTSLNGSVELICSHHRVENVYSHRVYIKMTRLLVKALEIDKISLYDNSGAIAYTFRDKFCTRLASHGNSNILEAFETIWKIEYKTYLFLFQLCCLENNICLLLHVIEMIRRSNHNWVEVNEDKQDIGSPDFINPIAEKVCELGHSNVLKLLISICNRPSKLNCTKFIRIANEYNKPSIKEVIEYNFIK